MSNLTRAQTPFKPELGQVCVEWRDWEFSFFSWVEFWSIAGYPSISSNVLEKLPVPVMISGISCTLNMRIGIWRMPRWIYNNNLCEWKQSGFVYPTPSTFLGQNIIVSIYTLRRRQLLAERGSFPQREQNNRTCRGLKRTPLEPVSRANQRASSSPYCIYKKEKFTVLSTGFAWP